MKINWYKSCLTDSRVKFQCFKRLFRKSGELHLVKWKYKYPVWKKHVEEDGTKKLGTLILDKMLSVKGYRYTRNEQTRIR